jgi:putative endonuclease
VSKKSQLLGKQGEEAAVSFLKKNGYKILRKNFRTRMGEVDIIALDRDVYCFIEVKTRDSLRFGAPEEAVSSVKQRQISKAALAFLKENNMLDQRARFDVVSVTGSSEGPAKTEIFRNAFELDASYIY